MDVLLQQHSVLIRRLRLKDSGVTVEDIEQFLDRLLLFLKTISYRPNKTDGLDILTIVCDDLASIKTIQLFNHPILINHPVFIYIGQTLEMLLTKSNHSQSISMKKHEEDAFYSISYLMTQLCLHRNEYIELFYGQISDKIFPVTDKPNIRDNTIDNSRRKANNLTEKPNLKIVRLHPSVPKSRPIEQSKVRLEMIPRPKKYPNRLTVFAKESKTTESSFRTQSSSRDLPVKTYQDVFLTSTFFDKLRRGIDDLSQNEYPPYHIKYKVIDRLVRLCSKMNVVDLLCDSIVKCLCSNLYYQVYAMIEPEQVRLTPKQLFFIYRCPQFIIRHEFRQPERISKLLCPVMVSKTKLIIDQVLSDNDKNPDSSDQNDKGLVLQALSSHLELLHHLSLTSSGRRYFLQSSISNQMISILHANSLLDNACDNEEFFHGTVRVIAYILMLLCNLAYEKTMFLLLKRTNFRDIYEKLKLAKDSGIKFAYNALSTILSDKDIDEDSDPVKLKQEYLEFLQENIPEAKQHVTLSGGKSYQNKGLNTKYVFLTESFLETLSDDIQDLSTTMYESNSTKYKRVVQRLRVCTKQNTLEVESLLAPVIECLKSRFYLSVFENIELTQAKVASGAMLNNRTLAPKHIFFMRECPEFLIQHDYQRKDDTNDLLTTNMLQTTVTIFEQHLPILTQHDNKTETSRGRTDGKNKDGYEEARIKALSYHVKLLNHFAMQPSIRAEFLNTPIIEDIITVLQDKLLLDQHGRIADKKVDFIGQSLTLLYNLALEKQILQLMQSRNLSNTCTKLRLINDKNIQFISQILLIALDEKSCGDLREINSLSKTCIEYLDKSIKTPKLCYRGIKLICLLKNLKIIVKNDSFSENLVEDKDGIPAITNCVSGFQSGKEKTKVENETINENPNEKVLRKIQHLAVDIVWILSFYGPTTIKTLKLNDAFIDEVLKLCNGPVNKPKKAAEAIIWRLGSEKMVRFEQTQKEEERVRNRRDSRTDMMDHELLTTADQWDDSVPFDLLISYSNNVNDKILSLKIADRLKKRNYRVYTEKQGKHRLELMEMAAVKQKLILACLSSKFRESKFCMAEIDHASKLKCPVIPVIVEENYTVKGWLNHIIANRTPIVFTNKNFNESFLNLIVEIDEIKHSE